MTLNELNERYERYGETFSFKRYYPLDMIVIKKD